jgi:hypothetical protein
MLNPFGPQKDPGPSSYVDLKKRILQKVRASNVNDQIFQIVQNAYQIASEKVVGTEIIVLSRPERKRLFAQILRSVLEDMITKLDQTTEHKP